MDTYLSLALDIVKAQARVRNMTEDEITAMMSKLAGSIKSIDIAGGGARALVSGDAPLDPKKAVKERTIMCMESGKPYKILTKRHLAKFGLTPEEYRVKWGYPKGMPLVCKALQRERRKKMREMQLWTRRPAG
ncbi:MucR family transcriptional regulator [Solidesulfovibrio sp. C21]|uniref:MucR family transcriptional regulator n=1 Tax=Solidesulfovibrio sp. C21 TaxID=3398613 RepID=UPI0039FBFAE5